MKEKISILNLICKLALKKTITYYEFILTNTKKNDEKKLLNYEDYQKIVEQIKNKAEIIKISTDNLNNDFINLCALIVKKKPKMLFVELLINQNFAQNERIKEIFKTFKHTDISLILLSDGRREKINSALIKKIANYFANFKIKPTIKVIVGKNNINDFVYEAKNLIYSKEFKYFFEFIKPDKKINNLTKLDLISVLDFLIHNTKNTNSISYSDNLYKNINLAYYKDVKKTLKKEKKIILKSYNYYKINPYGKVSYGNKNFNLKKNDFNLKEFEKQVKKIHIEENFFSYENYLIFVFRKFFKIFYLMLKSFFEK